VAELGVQTDVSLGVEPTTVALELAQPARPDARLYLVVEGVHIDRHPGVIYAMFLDLPDADESTPLEHDRLAGMLSFFGAAQARSAHEYDVTPVVGRLAADGNWDERVATVTFVPTGLDPPEGQDVVPGAATEGAEGAGVRLGRVSLEAR
jgi:hypothetical protein